MEWLTAGALGVLLGLTLAVGARVLVRMSEGRQAPGTPAAPVEPAVPEGVADVLAVLRDSAIVLDAGGAVVKTSASAVAHGLVRGNHLTHGELRDLVAEVQRDGIIREAELELARGPLGQGRMVMGVRVAPIGTDLALVLVVDRTKARRVEEVRRDFVVNVSHELKTPVGGLALLAEAVEDASDDPVAVSRFAGRMKVETTRLSRLVSEIVDLSRLQTADLDQKLEVVNVPATVAEATDQTRIVAGDRQITVSTAGPGADLTVHADQELLITAVRNLVTNAINYSDDNTRIAVVTRRHGDLVEVSVTDQGQGISAENQERIFERFYRVDAARSRATGGTGLGLSIVKHICANLGGDVVVWSEVGQGSTFTIRLPAAHRAQERQRRSGAAVGPLGPAPTPPRVTSAETPAGPERPLDPRPQHAPREDPGGTEQGDSS